MEKKFAVFIDGDNICAKDYVSAIREIATYGEILMKRVYGDWTTSNMNTWKDVLVKEPATPCQQFRSGKNATDTRIIMDAIELMFQNANVNAFCIVSTDADFCGLAQRLRENGKYVLGIGKEHSKPIWQETCDKFVKLESLNCEETGVLLERPRHFGLIENDRGVFYCSLTDIDGDIKNMAEGAQVTFRVLKEPDSLQHEKRNQRGKAANVRLVA
ncbi:hypothetical protein R84B8_00460 [Treponema sp. R8-4-B8]